MIIVRWIKLLWGALVGVFRLGAVGPGWAGFFSGLGNVTLLAAAVAVLGLTFGVADPSAGLLRQLAEVGVGLFVAFTVVIGTVELREGTRYEHLSWLGFGCGVGFSGLTGIGVCLALSAYREAGHAGWLDVCGLAWATASMLVLGVVISAGPLMTYRSRGLPSSGEAASPTTSPSRRRRFGRGRSGH